ncbi:MAG: sel1 repeat family protein [Burkholderiales bacterium]|nr:sel1 repeat family protein [Burkholderiales bacterium]
MRKEWLDLRERAKKGDPQASLAFAALLFTGQPGLARNYRLGIAYLQHLVEAKSRAAIELVCTRVPLDVLCLTGLSALLLENASRLAVPSVQAKAGLLLVFRSSQRAEAQDRLRASGLPQAAAAATDVARFAQQLSSEEGRLLESAFDLAWINATEALREARVEDAQWATRAADALAPRGPRLCALVLDILRKCLELRVTLQLSTELVEWALDRSATSGQVDAMVMLGSALAGLPHRELPWQSLVQRTNTRRAMAVLLRAADGGSSEAWLKLAQLGPYGRVAVIGWETRRFFLEKAAGLGDVEAQTLLGGELLRRANSVDEAAEGVGWLDRSAEAGNTVAKHLLQSLVLPLPEMAPERERKMLADLSANSPELAERVALARVLHLTRREALSFHVRDQVKPWGLLLRGTSKENPVGRCAPAVSPAMRTALERASSFFRDTDPISAALLKRRSALQRQVFLTLDLREEQVFAPEIGRSRTEGAYGRHWARKVGWSAPEPDRFAESGFDSGFGDLAPPAAEVGDEQVAWSAAY